MAASTPPAHSEQSTLSNQPARVSRQPHHRTRHCVRKYPSVETGPWVQYSARFGRSPRPLPNTRPIFPPLVRSGRPGVAVHPRRIGRASLPFRRDFGLTALPPDSDPYIHNLSRQDRRIRDLVLHAVTAHGEPQQPHTHRRTHALPQFLGSTWLIPLSWDCQTGPCLGIT